MKNKKMVLQALACFILILGLILPTSLAEVSAAVTSMADNRSIIHSGVDGSSDLSGTTMNLLKEQVTPMIIADWYHTVGLKSDGTVAASGLEAEPNNWTLGDTVTPIEIWDWYDLDAIRNDLDGNYTLMNDLDSTTAGYEVLASPAANDGKGWQPIGGIEIIDPDPLELELVDPFAGSFDGQGFEIRDLFIHRPDEAAVALFGSVAGWGIENVKLLDANVTGNFGVGILVGANLGSVSGSCSSGSVGGDYGVGGLTGGNFGNVSDSHSRATVIGVHDGTGGLVGFNAGNLSQCYAIGNVSCNDHVGGLVGMNGGDNYYGTVTDSYASGGVNGVSRVGGLVGDNNDGTVSDSYASGSVTGENDVGGLVGYNGGSASYSRAIGSVSGTGNVGGLVGRNQGNLSYSYASGGANGISYVGGLVGQTCDGTVSYSYASGSVNGTSFVGGLAGQIYDDTVNCSYATGNVTGSLCVGGLIGNNHYGTVSGSYAAGSVSGSEDVGGLIGSSPDGTVSDSFWDIETSGQTASSGGIGRTTAEMKDITTFTDIVTEGLDEPWDMTAVVSGETNPAYIWNIVDGITYPFLSWQQAMNIYAPGVWSRVDTPSMQGWTLAPESTIVDYAVADEGEAAYAIVYSDTEGYCLLTSEDGAATWEDITDRLENALDDDESINELLQVATDGEEPDFLAVALDIPDIDEIHVFISVDGGDTFEDAGEVKDVVYFDDPDDVSLLAVSYENGDGDREIAIGGVDNLGAAALFRCTVEVDNPGDWEDATDYDGWDNVDAPADDFTSDIVTWIIFSPSWETDKTILVTTIDDYDNTWTTVAHGDVHLQSGSWGTSPGWNEKSTLGIEAVLVKEDVDMPYFCPRGIAGITEPEDYNSKEPDDRILWVWVNYYDPGPGNPPMCDIMRVDDDSADPVGPMGQIEDGELWLSNVDYQGTILEGEAIAGVIGDGMNEYAECCDGVQVYHNDGIRNMDICFERWHDSCKPPTGRFVMAVSYVGEDKAYAVALEDDGVCDEGAWSWSFDDGDTWNQLSLIDTDIDYFSDVAVSPDCNKTMLVSVNDQNWFDDDEEVCEYGNYPECENVECCGCDSVWLRAENLPEAAEYSGKWLRTWCGQLEGVNDDDIPGDWFAERGLLRLAPEETTGDNVFLVDRMSANVYWNDLETLACWDPIGSTAIDHIVDLAAQDADTLFALDANGEVAKFDDDEWHEAVDSEVDYGWTIAIWGDNILVGGQDGDVSHCNDGGETFSVLSDVTASGYVTMTFDTYFDTNNVVYAALAGAGTENGVYRWVIDESEDWKNLRAEPYDYTGLIVDRPGNPHTSAETGGILYASYVAEAGSEIITGVARCLRPADQLCCEENAWDYLDDGLSSDTAFAVVPSPLKICGSLTPLTSPTLFAIGLDPDEREYDMENGRYGTVWRFIDAPRTWRVDDDLIDYPAADFTTIQDAVDAASAGDTIIVYPGTYIENVNVNKDYLTIQSENGAETTIVQPGYPTTGSYPPGPAVFSICDIGGGSEEVYGVTISGFTIEETKLPPEEDYLNPDDTAAFSLYKAHECEISSNRIMGTGYSYNFGIKLQRSSNNRIISNNIENGSLFIIDDSYFDEETGSLVDRGCHDNVVESNKVNGKPLVYLENASSQTVTDAGQVILINCDDIILQGLQLSSVYNGIELLTTNSSKILGNTIEQDFGIGVLLNCSLNNEIKTNNITVECGTGIGLSSSCDNIIGGNNISIFQQHTDYSSGGNTYQAIDLWESDDNTVETNLINVNNWVGIQITYSLRNEVNNNIMHSYTNHGTTGIRICLASNNIITDNELNDIDIVLGSCWSGPPPPPNSVVNTVDNNRILGTRGGLFIYARPNQTDTITNNTFTDCGIFIDTWTLEDSSLYHSIVEGNTVNNKPLVYLENESEQTINDAGQVILVNCQDITVEDSNLIGIQFWASNDSRIANNNISLNWTHGIIFFQSSNNEIEGNTISLHNYGLQITDSQNNRITKNEIAGNVVGLAIGSSNNEIYLNDFIENTWRNSLCDTDANSWSSPGEITYTYNGETYTSFLGNYWDDYTGSDANGDGVGDTPYPINSDVDNYPLMEPFDNYVPIGYAILVAGQSGLSTRLAINYNANNVYRVLRNLGYDDDRILYLNSNFPQDVDDDGYDEVDASSSLNDFIDAIEWAKQRVNRDAPFVLYLIGHGSNDPATFLFDEPGADSITPSYLNNLLESFPEQIPIFVGIDACYSGIFITPEYGTISLPDRCRVIATSAHDDQKKWAAITGRLFFSDDFWRNLHGGLNVKDAFVQTGDVTYSWLDDNGDAVGHPPNLLEDDGKLAERTRIGSPGIENIPLKPFTLAELFSPAELRVYDSQGRVTGLVNGEVIEEIPNSMYDSENEAVVVFDALDDHEYRVVGLETETYGLSIASNKAGDTQTFAATDIPTTSGAVHQYTIDWDALSQGEAGVTIKIDSDGDGDFEETIVTSQPDMPSSPWPACDATGVDINADLTWSGGDPDAGDTVTYGVYFGTNSTPPFKETIGPYPATQSSITYDPGTLVDDTTYYWQIIARDNHGVTKGGPVWEFTVEAEIQLSLRAGWNMVSVPLTLLDNSTSAVFPGVAGVFTWNATSRIYYMPTVIDPEEGYWVAVTENTTLTISGTPVDTWTTDVKAGWNMIGSVATNSSIADPNDEPDGSVIPIAYWWVPESKSYILTTDIELGKGYWAASVNDCTLTL